MTSVPGRRRLRIVPAAIVCVLLVAVVVAIVALVLSGGDENAGPPPPAINVKPYIGHGNVADCTTFKSQADAQAVLRADPSDRNGLDRNHDGIACPERPAPKDTFPVGVLIITDKDGAPIDPDFETAKRKEREAAKRRRSGG